MSSKIDEAYIKSINLPEKPGIYIFKDNSGKIIYIGKSKLLNKRVAFYFQNKKFGNTKEEILYGDKIRKLVSNIHEIDYIVTENEKEALILERDLIKKHQPVYNSLLKDDKSFPWIMITYDEKFPRILVVRQPHKLHKAGTDTKNKFYGPYIDVKPMKDTLKLLRKFFPYCTCKRCTEKRSRACLNYQIKLCPGPCVSEITQKKYLLNITTIDRILSGDLEGIIAELNIKMDNSSKETDFESAAIYRDTITALKNMVINQSIVSYEEGEKINRDIIGIHKTLTKIGFIILHVRNGRLIGKTPLIINSKENMGTNEEILNSVLSQYYLDSNRSIPDDIILPDDMIQDEKLDFNSLISILQDRYEKEVIITPAGKGRYTQSLQRIALKNVQLMIKLENEYEKILTEADVLSDMGMDTNTIQTMKRDDREALVGLKEIKDLLNLEELPRIIEGFDISNLQTTDKTGAMVAFIDGRPSKKNYRSYIIKEKEKLGDYHMMQEVIERRYTGVLRNNGILPDLVVVDGGSSQVNAAEKILKNTDELSHIKVIGLKKGVKHSEISHIVYKNPKDLKKTLEIKLDKNSTAYKLLQHISSEYHRRAIQHHRKRMEKRMLSSELDDVPGIGNTTKISLLDKFQTVDKIRSAKLEEIQDLLGEKRGKNIYNSIKEFYKGKEPKKVKKIVIKKRNYN